jgi:hypothetical protein
MRRDFDRYGIGYMPCTNAGCVYLFAFILATLAVTFMAGALWQASDLPGVEVVRGLILVAGIIATIRFAHRRSN